MQYTTDVCAREPAAGITPRQSDKDEGSAEGAPRRSGFVFQSFDICKVGL